MADLTNQDLEVLYENALLGFIIQDPQKMMSVTEILPDDSYFNVPDNKFTYRTFLKLFSEDRFPGSIPLIIDALYTAGEEVKKRTTDKKVQYYFETKEQAARYVNDLLDITVNPEFYNPNAFIEYADKLKWAKDQRDIKLLGQTAFTEVDRVSYDDREQFIGKLEDGLAEITMAVHGKEGLKHISEITGGLSEQLDMLHSGQRLASGILTGIDSLDKTMNGLKGGEVCVLAARPASGKSNICSTVVTCYDAKNNKVYQKEMKDLEIGDFVYNRHGKPVMVTGVFPQGKLDAYELTFSDGRTSICSEDHIWPYWQNTRRGGQRAEVINTLTLKEMLERGINAIRPKEQNDPTRKNRSRFAMPVNDAVEFPSVEHKITPYVMGVFLGDGCKNNNKRFELSSEHEYHVKQIAEQLGAAGYHKTSYSWSFYANEGDRKYLRVADVDPEYEKLLSQTCCGDKYIPKEYLLDSIEHRWELMRGLMDTDGSIAKEPWRNPLSFHTTSRQMAYDFRFLCNSLGLIAHISEQDRRGQIHSTGGKEYVRKSIEYSVSILVPNELKEKFFTVKHKVERAKLAAEHGATRNAKYDRIQLKKVEKLPEKQPMICISVDDPEELYLCNDFLVTHNTTLSMQIAYNVAMAPRDDHKRNAVLIFSLEMMEEQLISRMIATVGRINMQAMMEEYQHFVNDHYYEKTYGKAFEEKMRAKLEEQYTRTQIALKHIKDLPIYPTTESGLSPNSIKSMIMQKKRELERKGEHLSLVVIDYLQLIVPNLGKANASRTEEVGDISRKMKLMAKEFDVPILLLAQLNRNAEVTERPNLKDLRESGSIEQDADKVLFIWCEHADKGINDFPEFQDDNAKREALRKEQMKEYITVAKNRQGETGDCKVIFDKGFQTFLSQSSEYTSGEQHETFEEFVEKYYQKTRNEDIFWPLRLGEIPEAYETHRYPKYRETDYLDPATGTVYTLSNDNRNGSSAQMGVRSVTNTYTNASQDVSAAQEKASQLDRIQPTQPPVIDDLETEFGELDDEPMPTDADATATNTDPIAGEPAGAYEIADETPWDEADDGEDVIEMDEAPQTVSPSNFIDDDDKALDLDALEMMDDLDDLLDEL